MRPLVPPGVPAQSPDPCFTRHDDDTGDAPVSAVTDTRSFWDHLGATRAEEYAAEDILPHVPVPVPPAVSTPLVDGFAPLGDMPDSASASLNDVLLAHDLSAADVLASAQHENSVSPAAMSAAYGLDLAETRLPPVAPFASVPPRPRRRRAGASRLGYRLQRIWLTPGYRIALKLGAPVAAVAIGLVVYFSDESRHAAVVEAIEAAKSAVIERPEFMITSLELPETAPELEPALREKLALDLPVSSFRLDLDVLRRQVEELDWVRSADLRLVADGVLSVSLTERVPAILWRSEQDLELLDAEGVRVAIATHRAARSDLPLVAGRGANAHIPEALDLLDAAAPLGDRLRGLVRVGERRWDVVLDRDQRIRLPETGAVPALERVIALDQAQDLLARDLMVADMRNPARPVLQISAGAMETLRDIRSQSRE